MSAIEEVLWNIFTFYSLNGNPRDPSRLHSMALLKMCKDIMALDQIMTETPISQADLHLIYTSVLKSPTKTRDNSQADKSDKLNFEEFLSCLLRISQKCYPSMPSQEESMQQLLMDNILPMAQRRIPHSILSIMKEPSIEFLMKYYDTSLMSMFKHFAAASDQLTKDRNMVRATRHAVKTFDDQVEQIQKANARCLQQSSVAKQMSYSDFIHFTADLGLISSLPITIVEFGDIYLTVISFSNFSPSLRRIDFNEFCETIVRIALRAFQDLHKVSTEDKVKGLLLNIWRYSQELLGAHMQEYGTLHGGGFNTSKEELLRSVETFGLKFKVAWAKDGYRNYLEPGTESGPAAPNATAGGGNKGAGTPAKKAGPAPATPNTGASKGAVTPGRAGSSRMLTPGTSTLMSKLKSASSFNASNSAAGANSSAFGADIGDTASVRSAQTGRSGTVAETISEMHSAKERLLSTLHEHVEESENFVVSAAGGQFRIMISERDKLGQSRVGVNDLKKLFLHKPEIAAILFDTMVEEGIVEENVQDMPINEDDDGLDALGISLDDLNMMQDGDHQQQDESKETYEGDLNEEFDGEST